MRKNRLSLVLAAALIPGFGAAESPPVDATFDADGWQARERELFDLLRADTSPRVQVLAGRVYLSDEDEGAPLRPKGEDVVARAANLAPDDAFVQAVAASEGNYYNSQCGPLRWPEAEVANLVRLEPDNAAAWRYAVALAQAKGDQAGIDTALERMAMARRADDHEGEEIATWTRVFTAHPDSARSTYGEEVDAAMPPRTALSAALERMAFSHSTSDSALERACAPDGSNEQAWRRLDWCARAGRVLVREGNSFALRELGLKLLGKGDSHADLRRQHAWLEANASDPSRNGAAFADAAADRESDWRDAAGSIVAAERRLARLGKPAVPPEGWTAGDAYDGADAEAANDAWLAYMGEVIEGMRASGDAREQVLALVSEQASASVESEQAVASGDDDSGDKRAITDIATAHPDDLLVQWVAAQHADADGRAAAIARLQGLDAANAATWAWSLPASNDAADPLPVLQRMAASRHHDEYAAGFIGIWSTAFARVPAPAEFAAQMQAMGAEVDAETLPKMMALSSMFHLTAGLAWQNVMGACAAEAVATAAARREPCLAVGRLLLRQSRSLLAARVGEGLLRKLDALRDTDAERTRQLAWWQENMQANLLPGKAMDAYFADWLSTGSEVEALRLAANRAGKAEPPADWQSPADKRAKKPVP